MNTNKALLKEHAGPVAGDGISDSVRRKWLFRSLTILLAMAPIVVAELSLRLLGWPIKRAASDPFVDLQQLEPLFELDDRGETYAIPSQRLHLFRPTSFSARKPENTLRIFALGGSTTQGEPFSTETAFPAWMGIRLQAAMPSRNVEVINCGGLSYASYRVRAILEEVIAYSPDLIVVYTGHNEYLEKRTLLNAKQSSAGQFASRIASHSNLLQSIQVAARGAASRDSASDPTRTVMAKEVDALLDYRSGLDDYTRSADWQEGIADQYIWNIRQILAVCKLTNTPVAFVVPVANLLDCPPIKFEDSPLLSADQLAAFRDDWEAAKVSQQAGRLNEAIEALNQALKIDPEHAGCHFLLGRIAYEQGDYTLARKHLALARDYDVCKLRAPEELTSALKEELLRHDIPLVDAQELFDDKSEHGIVGSNWLVDHIHPTLEGNQLLGQAMADMLLSEVFEQSPNDDWQTTEDAAVAAHISSLGEDYFHRGKQRLEGLLLWTQGRAKKLRAPEP